MELDGFVFGLHSLVLQTMGALGQGEQAWGSHVERLLEKLPTDQFCWFKRSLPRATPPRLLQVAWLQLEASRQPRREQPPVACREKPLSKSPRVQSAGAGTALTPNCHPPKEASTFAGTPIRYTQLSNDCW